MHYHKEWKQFIVNLKALISVALPWTWVQQRCLYSNVWQFCPFLCLLSSQKYYRRSCNTHIIRKPIVSGAKVKDTACHLVPSPAWMEVSGRIHSNFNAQYNYLENEIQLIQNIVDTVIVLIWFKKIINFKCFSAQNSIWVNISLHKHEPVYDREFSSFVVGFLRARGQILRAHRYLKTQAAKETFQKTEEPKSHWNHAS